MAERKAAAAKKKLDDAVKEVQKAKADQRAAAAATSTETRWVQQVSDRRL